MYRPQVAQSLGRVSSGAGGNLEGSIIQGRRPWNCRLWCLVQILVSNFPTRQSVTIQCSSLLLFRILPLLVSPLVACRLAPEGHPTLFSPLNLNVDRLSPASAPPINDSPSPHLPLITCEPRP